MVEFIRDEHEGQIYSDLARRIGYLQGQYRDFANKLPPDEVFDDTLAVCVLHPLLAIYAEARKRFNPSVFQEFRLPVPHIPAKFGISRSMIKEFTFYDKFACLDDVSFDFVLESIRDALSHPCPISEERFLRTGYVTIPGKSRKVERFRFVNSPDVRGNLGRPSNYDEVRARRIFEEIAQRCDSNKFVLIGNPGTRGNKFHIAHANGNRLVRKIVIEIPADSLELLVTGLSDILSRPIREILASSRNVQSRPAIAIP